MQPAREDQSRGHLAAAEASIWQQADQGRDPREKNPEDARSFSRRLDQFGEDEDRCHSVAHAPARMALSPDRLFRGSSGRPQSVADLGRFCLRSTGADTTRRLSRDRQADRQDSGRAEPRRHGLRDFLHAWDGGRLCPGSLSACRDGSYQRRLFAENRTGSNRL